MAVGPRLEYQHHNATSFEEGGQLETGEVLGTTGGAVIGLGLALDWDHRDNRYQPSEGWYIQSRIMQFVGTNSDGYNFLLGSLDWRAYRRMASAHILAGQIFVEGANDGTPYWRLPSLGGESYARAYSRDRWLDDTLVAAQGEWRWQAMRRWGAVAFAGAGVVDDDLRSLQFKYLRPSVGVGIRYFTVKGDDLVPIRLDFAVGYDNWRFSFGISEAF